jgi:hypothetical protein
MVITSNPSNGSSTTALEQVEPVKDDPPIGGPRQPDNYRPDPEKAREIVAGAGSPASSPRDELCKNAHIYDPAHLATQLDVDFQ